MDHKYTRIVLSIIAVGLLSAIIFNGVVDPYGVIGAPRIEGFNADKPEANRRERLSKAYEVKQVRPSAVLLGTSRAKCLDAQHPSFSNVRAYNLAISSSSIYEQWRYFEHAMAVQPLEEAVIGLDFDAFRDGTSGFFSETRLVPAGGTDATRAFDATDLLAALLSFDALRSSFATIAQQESRIGMTESDKMAQKVRRNHGHRAMFRHNETGVLRNGENIELGELAGIGTAEEPKAFRKLLRLAHRGNVRLHLFISPMHARFFEAWHVAGVGPRIEAWKRMLVAVNIEEARLAGREPFPLWDFSGYNSITSEPIPNEGDIETVMRGYSEGSHYRDEIGRLVFDRMLGHRDLSRPLPDDFGVRVDERNIESHLAAIRAARAHYRAAFSREIAELETEYARQQSKKAFARLHKVSAQAGTEALITAGPPGEEGE